MTTTEKIVGNTANFVDERLGAAKWVKKSLNKVFPDHWSFMLGEVCMYSFVILLLSGTFLTLWFDPSQKDVIYDGVYEPLKGLKMSAAYASTLDISFEVRGGLLMRQIHHWAANIFMAILVLISWTEKEGTTISTEAARMTGYMAMSAMTISLVKPVTTRWTAALVTTFSRAAVATRPFRQDLATM